MGLGTWYDEKILSKIVTSTCGSEEVSALRKHVVPLATGKVFELGCGGGLNQSHYNTDKITAFAGIDPNNALLDGARERAKANGWEDDIRNGVGEAIPFDDGLFDSVVCTFTLCSVSDQAKVVSEMRRILKPGGKLLYLEHGKAPDSGPAKLQKWIEPVWKPLMGNCHLTREIGSVIAAGGFDVEPIGEEYFETMPKWAGWMEWGVATKPAA